MKEPSRGTWNRAERSRGEFDGEVVTEQTVFQEWSSGSQEGWKENSDKSIQEREWV